MGPSLFNVSSFMFNFLAFEILPHRQCWEQERTTCSGGYPSATCSAFLHYCDGDMVLFIVVIVIITIQCG